MLELRYYKTRNRVVESKPVGVHKKCTNFTLMQKGGVPSLICKQRMKSTEVGGKFKTELRTLGYIVADEGIRSLLISVLWMKYHDFFKRQNCLG